MLALLLSLILGALAASGTIMHTFSVSFDILVASVGYNRSYGVTLSSYAGLAARHGRDSAARFINRLFFDSKHCEHAIKADANRCLDALDVLFQANPNALAVITLLKGMEP